MSLILFVVIQFPGCDVASDCNQACHASSVPLCKPTPALGAAEQEQRAADFPFAWYVKKSHELHYSTSSPVEDDSTGLSFFMYKRLVYTVGK